MDLWARTLPLFMAAAVSPTMLAIAVLILTTPKGRSNLVWFTLGWSAGVAAFIAFIWFGGHAMGGPSRTSALVDVFLGVLMIGLGIMAYLRRNRPKKPKDPNRRPMGPLAYLGGGALAVLSDFSSLVPLAAAMKEVGQSRLPATDKIPFAVAGYLFISLPVLVPLFGAFVAPEASKRMLDRLSAWLDKHGALVVAIVFAAMGCYLIFKGGRVLHWFG